VVAGAGYAGLHAALRLTARLRNNPMMELTLVDRHDYHQVLTELPRVAGGTRAADAVRIPLQDTLAERVRFAQTEINGFDLAGRRLVTGAGPIGWRRLVLALGSRPNDFAIPGLADRTLSVYSASDAERVWEAVSKALDDAAAAADPERQRRLATVVVGGGGATGVELAGELAEVLPEVASRHGLAADRPAVLLVEAGPTILAGSSPQLIDKATRILSDLGVQVRTNAAIAAATEEGFRLKDGQLVEGGVFVWAGGVKAPELVADSGLPTGHNGRVKVDRYLRVLDHPEIYAAGDLASVTDPRTGHVLPPLAQVALEEGETVARNLDAELEGRPLEAFTFHDKGFVVSVGTRRRGRRHRRHHQRRAAGPPAQGRHRVGVPPVRYAPARLGPNSPVTAANPAASDQGSRCRALASDPEAAICDRDRARRPSLSGVMPLSAIPERHAVDAEFRVVSDILRLIDTIQRRSRG
jgi:NADH dehydrogenase